MATRVSQKIGALLRRLGLPYQGNESYGKIRIYGLTAKRWLQPKLETAPRFGAQPTNFNLSEALLGKKITDQQRNIRTGNLSL
uniref:Uncharacterized protein n=1 Tax=Kalanchoe fedtschenkoi TaxID=63787 RepID=A0A7N0T8U6_KALFE